MKKDFIDAYIWLYGGTKKHAAEIYKESAESWIRSVIDCYNGLIEQGAKYGD